MDFKTDFPSVATQTAVSTSDGQNAPEVFFFALNINVLMLAVGCKGVAFPLMFSMLNKRGNSHRQERINLINRYIRLSGKDTVDCLPADREFVGCDRIKYMNDNGIRYSIRIRENFWVKRHGKKRKASWLSTSNAAKPGFCTRFMSMSRPVICLPQKSKTKEDKPELQIVISFNHPKTHGNFTKNAGKLKRRLKR